MIKLFNLSFALTDPVFMILILLIANNTDFQICSTVQMNTVYQYVNLHPSLYILGSLCELMHSKKANIQFPVARPVSNWLLTAPLSQDH